jgi:hypothetical protein
MRRRVVPSGSRLVAADCPAIALANEIRVTPGSGFHGQRLREE